MRHLALAATLVAGTMVGSAATATAADPMTDGLVISEIHYDNSGGDTGEFVEVAGPAGTDLTGWSIVLYNGSNGTAYRTIALIGTIDDEDGTHGAVDFQLPTNGLQNGSPDGLALIDPAGGVVEFLSYEGELTATNGPAAGDTSTDIGVAEPSSTPIGDSLQLIDGVWTGPAANSAGILNSQPPPPPPPPESCEIPAAELDLISEVQGVGDASPLVNTEVTVRGVVTLADNDLDGFWVQEEPADQDADPATSEGIFVFDFRELPVEGQTVTLTDVVTERFGQTQLSVPDIDICDVPLVTIEPTSLILPLDDDAREAYEGMLVTNAQDLQVTGLFTAYRFGELGLALDGPLPVPTSVYAPGTPEAAALAAENAAKELIVNDRNEAFSQFNPYPWERFDEDLSAGDTMPATRLVGALAYSFGDFKVEPLDNAVGGDRIFFPETDDTFPRPEAPDLRGGNDVATFNVLNYFNTFGNSAVLRGATNQADFEVQTAKLVDAINRLDASVVGLIEIENDYEDFYDGDPATVPSIVTLVDALNAAAGVAKWTYIQPPESILTDEGLGGGGLGPDAIATGLIYQTDRARPIGSASTFNIDAELSGDVENNRWPIAQQFQIKGNLATVVVNHFKSKGSSCTDTAGPDFELGEDVGTDETGNCNLTRQYAAERLVEWANSKANNSWAGKVLLVGDFNSYEEEAPIETLVDAGYVDLVQRDGADAFTYKFDGRYGRLDYVFASSKLAKKASEAAVWQINSAAPVGYLYDNDPIDLTAHGSSDHDPVVVSLK
jgi:predicted extracellular nuclease